MESLEERLTPAAGDLDLTFGGGDGIVTTAFSDPSFERGESVAVDSEGRYVVAGQASHGGFEGFALTRYTSAGVLDTTFGGGDGIVLTSIDNSNDYPRSVAVDNAGRYVVAGHFFNVSSNGGSSDIALVRYTSAGVLDTSFGGGDGIVTTDNGNSRDFGNSVAVDRTGKYVVAGSSFTDSNSDIALFRYTSAGMLDTSFGGGDGIVTTSINTIGEGSYSMVVDSAGRYVVAGYVSYGSNSTDIALVRYTSDGALDTSFGGGDGIVTTDISTFGDLGFSVAEDKGRYVVAGHSTGSTGREIAVVRYTSAGMLDTSFGGGDGVVTTRIDNSGVVGNSIAVDKAGRYVVAGSSNDGTNTILALTRYTSDGVLDTSFGDGDGIVTQSFSASTTAKSVAVDSDGKYLVAGEVYDGSNYDFALARFESGSNLPPSDLTLSTPRISENAGLNAIVGTLSATNPNATGPLTFSLVSGAGDTHNASFNIFGNQLHASNSFDFEAGANNKSIRVRGTDSAGFTYESVFTISVVDVNEAPNVSLLPVVVALAENTSTANRIKIADIAVIDDALGTETLSLNGTHASSFEIIGTELFLRAGTSLNYETRTSYSVEVWVNDSSVGSNPDARTALTLSIVNVNERPTDMVLSLNTLPENAGVNAFVGSLSSTDPDQVETLTYSLAAGVGDTDNAFFNVFNINGAQLRANDSFNFEAGSNSKSVRIRVTDAGGNTYEEPFTITILNVNEAPSVGLANLITSLAENTSTANRVKLGDIVVTDDALGSETISLSGADAANFELVGAELFLRAGTVLNYETQSSYQAHIAIDDPTIGLNPDSISPFVLNLINVEESPTDIALSNSTIFENAGLHADVGIFSVTDPHASGPYSFALVPGAGDADNSAFNIIGSQLRASQSFNFEAGSTSKSVRVRVTNSSGNTYEESFAITILNVNEAPSVALANLTTALTENTSTANRIKLANIVVTDDALGNETLSLSGADAAKFEIVGTELFLKAGTVLNFEAKRNYLVHVDVDDPTIGSGIDSSALYTLNVLDVNEAPTAGELDLTFGGGDGIVTTPVGPGNDLGQNLTVDPLGRYVVAGYAFNGSDFDFALTRYTSAGLLDTSFGGGDGIVTTPIGSGNDYAYSVAVDQAGRYVLAGQALAGTSQFFALTRFTSAGVLDTTFGEGDGIVTLSIVSSNSVGYSVAVDSAGRYVVAGSTQTGSNSDFALARLTADGLLDTTFGGGQGFVITPIGSSDNVAFSVAIDQLGRYVLAGYAYNGTNTDFALARYTTTGALDTAFGGGSGTVTSPVGTANDFGLNLAIDPAGRYVVAGYAFTGANTDFALTRYTSAGLLDTSFGGGDGMVTTAVGTENDFGFSVAVDQAGRYVVAGQSLNGSNADFALTRYTSSGLLDTSFGEGNGIVTRPISSGSDVGRSVVVDQAGRYVVAGYAHIAGSDDFALARFKSSINSPPSSMSLSNTSIAENAGINALVGTLSASDPDANETFTFSLVAGSGSADNASFNISGTQLRSASSFDFEAGANNKTIRVRVTDSAGNTYEQTFTITITDVNEAPVNISINDVRRKEGGSGTTPFTFTVSLSPASAQSVSVQYRTTNSTARSLSDYSASTGVLTFSPGETSKTLTVNVRGESRREANESFHVLLSNPVNGNLTDGQGVGTIVNDDYSLATYSGSEFTYNSADISFGFGSITDTPLQADIDGDGVTDIGVWRAGRFYFDTNADFAYTSADQPSRTFGISTDKPIMGDWTGTGIAKMGVFRNGLFYLDLNGDGLFNASDTRFAFGAATDTPIVGDWNGDGSDEIGVWRAATATFFLDRDNSRSYNAGDVVAPYGALIDKPVIGDWNGDGRDQLAVWRNGRIFLDTDGNFTYDQGIDQIRNFGSAGDTIFAGDWSGDGISKLGLNANGIFRLDHDNNSIIGHTKVSFVPNADFALTGDFNGDGVDDPAVYHQGMFSLETDGLPGFKAASDAGFTFGSTTGLPVLGDWNGDGIDDVGIFANGMFHLDSNGNRVLDANDAVFLFANATDRPIAGDWNGDGRDEVGVWRPSTATFILDADGSRSFNGADANFTFGASIDTPLVGDWNGDGRDDVGVWRNGLFYLDSDGNQRYNAGLDRILAFGSAAHKPLTGRW